MSDDPVAVPTAESSSTDAQTTGSPEKVGWWSAGECRPAFTAGEILSAFSDVRQPLHVVIQPERNLVGLAAGGEISSVARAGALPLLASLGPSYPEWLGDRAFQETHGCRFPYVVGEMANGIATAQMVVAAGRAGLLGFFGSAGLLPARIEESIARISAELDPTGTPWGANLIHSPNEPELERAVTDLFLERRVRRVSASAFMAPLPMELLQRLVAREELTQTEAELARHIPLAEDLTVEADSGGHTDNRPLAVVLPIIKSLRERVTREYRYPVSIRLGAAGGIGCPNGVAAAFSLGAAYVLTGSINQAAVESGLSPGGRAMLAEADMADVTMAPAADMFELGVNLQVLKRGTLFAARAARLYQIFVAHDSIDAIPPAARLKLETDLFRMPLDDVWEATRRYFSERRPQDSAWNSIPSISSRSCVVGTSAAAHKWAIAGDGSRQIDYQIWCGPAMGAFNDWVAGTFLEALDNRSVTQIGLNLLEGATVIGRAHQLRGYGVPMPAAAFQFRPRPLR